MVVTCSMARRFAQKMQLFDESDERNDDTTSSRDHEREDKTVEYRIYPAEGNIFCENSIGENEISQPASFFRRK